MKYFPVFVDLEHQIVLLAGDSEGVLAKAYGLLKTTANLHVYCLQPSRELQRLAADQRIKLHRAQPGRAAIEQARLVYIACRDVAAAREIRALCRAAGVLCNTVDDAGSADFISAAIVDRDPVVVAIGSEGSAPLLVRRIKRDIEQQLASTTGAVARLAARLRPVVKTHLDKAARLRFWEQFFGGAADRVIEHNGSAGARRYFHRALRADAAAPAPAKTGRVAIVGAGPGDPDLLTLKAVRLLAAADVVLYDRLVDPRILDHARREATLTEVGKIPGGQSWAQNDINHEMLRHAEQGAQVVRLKSGDPMVFGRADEELDALTAAGIPCTVVAGVTAAASAAASMQTSLTRRGRNSAFTVLTAQDTAGYAEHDWRQLARVNATSAIYMGVRAAPFVQGRLLLHGADPATPISIVENASRNNERLINARLGELSAVLETQKVVGPAVIFIGLHARSRARELVHPAPPARAVA